MLTGKTSRTMTTTTLASLALALGVVACDKNAPDNSMSSNNNPIAPTPNTPAAAGSANLTGATVQQDPLANVENRASIKDYPDETKFNPPRQAQLITGFAVEARESPRGDVVTSVETSAPVRELARDARGDYYLVVFSDPKDATKQIAGWYYKDALEKNYWPSDTAGAAGSTAKGKSLDTGKTEKLSCSRGQSHVRTSIDFCAKTCKDDTGCDKKAGEICDGLGFEVHESTGKLANANYCISSTSPKANADQRERARLERPARPDEQGLRPRSTPAGDMR